MFDSNVELFYFFLILHSQVTCYDSDAPKLVILEKDNNTWKSSAGVKCTAHES